MKRKINLDLREERSLLWTEGQPWAGEGLPVSLPSPGTCFLPHRGARAEASSSVEWGAPSSGPLAPCTFSGRIRRNIFLVTKQLLLLLPHFFFVSSVFLFPRKFTKFWPGGLHLPPPSKSFHYSGSKWKPPRL